MSQLFERIIFTFQGKKIVIPYNKERVTVIHGPNGSGKSLLLRALGNFFEQGAPDEDWPQDTRLEVINHSGVFDDSSSWYIEGGFACKSREKETRARAAMTIVNNHKFFGGTTYSIRRCDQWNLDFECSSPFMTRGQEAIRDIIFSATLYKVAPLIEEVESGLHPSVQEKIIPLLIDLAEKMDLYFFVTTHSPYIPGHDFAHLMVATAQFGGDTASN